MKANNKTTRTVVAYDTCQETRLAYSPNPEHHTSHNNYNWLMCAS